MERRNVLSIDDDMLPSFSNCHGRSGLNIADRDGLN
jgi:hypothetical protein